MFNKILSFLFGSKPDIFNEKGEVCHKLPVDKWTEWDSRYKDPNSANWRNHKGTEAKN